MFIVHEGFDAAGKRTQTEMMQTRLERLGCEVLAISFPRYKTQLGEIIRKHLFREVSLATHAGDTWEAHAPEDAMMFQCMMVVDKYDAAAQIAAALKRGATVIADRWWQSAFAYGAADGLPRDWLFQAHHLLPIPDLNVFIDISPEEALRRRPQLRDRYEQDREKQVVVRANYKSLWAEAGMEGPHRRLNWHIVDGEVSEQEVHERIWQLVVREQERRMRP
jgi:dTMP kinase